MSKSYLPLSNVDFYLNNLDIAERYLECYSSNLDSNSLTELFFLESQKFENSPSFSIYLTLSKLLDEKSKDENLLLSERDLLIFSHLLKDLYQKVTARDIEPILGLLSKKLKKGNEILKDEKVKFSSSSKESLFKIPVSLLDLLGSESTVPLKRSRNKYHYSSNSPVISNSSSSSRTSSPLPLNDDSSLSLTPTSDIGKMGIGKRPSRSSSSL